MTSIGLKAQIQELIARHMAQIDAMMSDAKSKETEAIYAGFAANRDETRKDSLEGEISLWEAKKSYSNTAKTHMEYSQIHNADRIRQRVEAKVKKLQSQQNAITSLLSFLKDQIESLKESQYANNPLVQMFVAFVELMTSVVERLAKAEEEKNTVMQQMTGAQQLNNVIQNSENLVEAKKQIQNDLLGQSLETKMAVAKENNVLNSKVNSANKEDVSSETRKMQVMQQIQVIQEKLQAEGKNVSLDKIYDLASLNPSEMKTKVVIDQALNSVYADLAGVLGEDNVIINRRENDRREANDRRNGSQILDSENRADTAGRRQGDRRNNNSIFLG